VECGGWKRAAPLAPSSGSSRSKNYALVFGPSLNIAVRTRGWQEFFAVP